MGTENNRKFPDEEKKVHHKYVAPLDAINYLLIALITEKHKKGGTEEGRQDDASVTQAPRRYGASELGTSTEASESVIPRGLGHLADGQKIWRIEARMYVFFGHGQNFSSFLRPALQILRPRPATDSVWPPAV